MKIIIVDYDAGNTKSVIFALQRIGLEASVTANPEEILSADRVIFPGVGHAQAAMKKLKQAKLDILIPTLRQPVLGICLGMQLMCNFTEEGNVEGLGVFDTVVKSFPVNTEFRSPQMGWNQIFDAYDEVFEGLKQEEDFYFVHSYYVPLCDYVIAKTTHGITFSSALRRNNFWGMQFHPEKSGKAGERLLMNFINVKE